MNELEFLKEVSLLLNRLGKASEKMEFNDYTDFQDIRLRKIPERIALLESKRREIINDRTR